MKRLLLGLGLACSLLSADEAITAQEARTHVAFLAADELRGRDSGTEYLRIAAQYIATRFEGYGLQAPNGSWFQDFALEGTDADPASQVSFGMGNGTMSFGYGEALALLPGCGNADTEALPVVFAGYGVTAPEEGYDDYEGLDVEGKIVLILRYTPELDGAFAGRAGRRHATFDRKISNAIEHGAAGVILVTGARNEGGDNFVGGGGGGRGFYEGPREREAGFPAVHLSRSAARSLASAHGFDLFAHEDKISAEGAPCSQAIEGLTAALRCGIVDKPLRTRNVVGFLPGTDLADEIIVVGGHYDHVGDYGDGEDTIHNGADDNASGTACMLEIAEALAARGPLRRSVLFIAFAAEEMGLWGSRWYVREPLYPLAKTVAMINLDMVGRNATDEIDVYGAALSPFMRTLVENENVENFRMSMPTELSGGSDHMPFAQNDIPFVFFFSGFHDDYHGVGDHVEKINAEKIARVGRLATRVVTRLGTLDNAPARLGERSYR